MNIPILNRDNNFAMTGEGWCQIAPKGEHAHPESKTVQVMDDASMVEICNRFTEESKNPNFPGVRVDFDHFSYSTDKSSEAAGWVTELQNRDDGLWGKVKWSTLGSQAIKGGVFKLLSPAVHAKEIAPGRVRPFRLDSVGLTNNPNIKGMVPLSNREADAKTIEEKDNMTKTLAALGLAPGTTDDTAAQAVEALKNRSVTPPAAPIDVTPLKNRIAELETENQKLTTAQIDGDMVKYSNRFKPEAATDWKAALITNRASTLKLLESLPDAATTTTAAGTTEPMRNRAAASIPGNGSATGRDEAKDAAEAAKLTRVIMNRDGVPWDRAWGIAQNEQPKLFGL